MWTMSHNNCSISGTHFLLSDPCKVTILAHIEIINQSQIERKEPPSMRQTERKVRLFLWHQPPSQPAFVDNMTLKSFKPINPIMISWN